MFNKGDIIKVKLNGRVIIERATVISARYEDDASDVDYGWNIEYEFVSATGKVSRGWTHENDGAEVVESAMVVIEDERPASRPQQTIEQARALATANEVGFNEVAWIEANTPTVENRPVDEIEARADRLFNEAQTALNAAVAAYEDAARSNGDAAKKRAYRLAKIAQKKAHDAEVPASKYFPLCDSRVFDIQIEALNVVVNAVNL